MSSYVMNKETKGEPRLSFFTVLNFAGSLSQLWMELDTAEFPRSCEPSKAILLENDV